MAEYLTNCKTCVDSDEIVKLYQKLRVEVTEDLDGQYEKGRINGTAYVDVYAKLMDRILGASVQAVIDLQAKETDADRAVKYSQVELNAAQENKLACDCCNSSKIADADVILKAQQGALYERQTQGFDDNARQKLFDSQLNSWAMVFADTALEEVVAPTNEQQICETYNAVKAGLGITGSACQ